MFIGDTHPTLIVSKSVGNIAYFSLIFSLFLLTFVTIYTYYL